jgi:hypothetical protein
VQQAFVQVGDDTNVASILANLSVLLTHFIEASNSILCTTKKQRWAAFLPREKAP